MAFETSIAVGFPTEQAQQDTQEIDRLLGQIRTEAKETGEALDRAFTRALGRRAVGELGDVSRAIAASRVEAQRLLEVLVLVEGATHRTAAAERAAAASLRTSAQQRIALGAESAALVAAGAVPAPVREAPRATLPSGTAAVATLAAAGGLNELAAASTRAQGATDATTTAIAKQVGAAANLSGAVTHVAAELTAQATASRVAERALAGVTAEASRTSGALAQIAAIRAQGGFGPRGASALDDLEQRFTSAGAAIRSPEQREADDRMVAEAAEVSRQRRAGSRQMRSSLGRVGPALLAGAGVGAAALSVAGSVESFAEFEESFDRMVATADVAEGEIEALRAAVMELAAEGGRGPQEVARGLLDIRSRGIEGQQGLELLRASVQATAIGMGDLASVIDAAASASAAYGPANLSAAHAVDIFTKAAQEGDANAREFMTALGPILPIAAELEVSLGDVAGAVAALTKQGMSARGAGTEVRDLLLAIHQPGEEARKTAQALEVDWARLQQTLSQQGIPALLKQIRQEIGTDTQVLSRLFGTSLAGAFALISDEGGESIRIIEAVGAAAGATEQAAGKLFERVPHQLKQANVELENARTKLGDVAAPAQIALVNGLASAIDAVAEALGGLPQPAAAGVAAVGGIALQVAQFGALAAPLALITTSVTGLGIAAIAARGGLVALAGASVIAGFGALAAAINAALDKAEGLAALANQAETARKRTQLIEIEQELARRGMDPARGPTPGDVVPVPLGAFGPAQTQPESTEQAQVNRLLQERMRLIGDIQALEGRTAAPRHPPEPALMPTPDPNANKKLPPMFDAEELKRAQSELDAFVARRIESEQELSAVATEAQHRRAGLSELEIAHQQTLIALAFDYANALRDAEKIPLPAQRTAARAEATSTFNAAQAAEALRFETQLEEAASGVRDLIVAQSIAQAELRDATAGEVSQLGEVVKFRSLLVTLVQHEKLAQEDALVALALYAEQVTGVMTEARAEMERLLEVGRSIGSNLLEGLTTSIQDPINALETLRATALDVVREIQRSFIQEAIREPLADAVGGLGGLLKGLPGIGGPLGVILEGAESEIRGIPPGDQAIVEAIEAMKRDLVAAITGKSVAADVLGIAGPGGAEEAGSAIPEFFEALLGSSEDGQAAAEQQTAETNTRLDESVEWLKGIFTGQEQGNVTLLQALGALGEGIVGAIGQLFTALAGLGGGGGGGGGGFDWLGFVLQLVGGAVGGAGGAAAGGAIGTGIDASTRGDFQIADSGGMSRGRTMVMTTRDELLLPLGTSETRGALKMAFVDAMGALGGGGAAGPIQVNVQIVNEGGEPLEESGRTIEVSENGRRWDVNIAVSQGQADDAFRRGPGFKALQSVTGGAIRRQVRSP